LPFVNDDTVADAERLLRRVPPYWWIYDGNLGCLRPTTAAFDDEEMSVALASSLLECNQALTSVLAGHDQYALVAITAGLARHCNQAVARDPLPDQPHHAVVFGKKPRSVLKTFKRQCVCIFDPLA
jgi:hypothetical protein